MADMFKALPRPTKGYHTTSYAAISPSRPELSLKGRTALITGGATGIGLETSLAFAEAGVATLAILARRQHVLDAAKAQIEQKFPKTKVLTFAASITDFDSVSRIVSSLATIDILILNAAHLSPPNPVLQTETHELTAQLETNVIGPFHLIKAFMALAPRDPAVDRTIIHVTSSSIQMPMPGVGAYTATKIAMTSLMATIHQEAQGKGVRAFSFHPAFAFTPLAKDVLGLKEGAMSFDSVTLPAHYAVWLASSEADFLKGRYTWAHWDVDDLKAKRDLIASDPNQLTVSLVQDQVVEKA